MNDFSYGMLLGIFLFWIVWEAYIQFKARNVKDLSDEECDQIVNRAMTEAGIIRATIEIRDDTLCMYSKEGKFYCQAPNFKELEKKTKEMYPDLLFHVPDSELEKAKQLEIK
jgi:hypothetical protein